MIFRVNQSSGIPLYLQLIEQVKHAVETGVLREGDRLPTIRKVAEDLVMNPNTVVRAYRELENEGVVELKHGSGAYIRESAGERTRVIQKAQAVVQSALERLTPLKLTDDELRRIFENELAQVRAGNIAAKGRFTNQQGASRYGRYRIVPEAGADHLPDAIASARSSNFLFDELAERIARQPIAFRILVQLADDEDIVDDATIHWPEERILFELGKLVLTAPVADNVREQKHIIFDPIPRVDGIDPSEDPLLELRAAIYLLSGRRRRTASEI